MCISTNPVAKKEEEEDEEDNKTEEVKNEESECKECKKREKSRYRPIMFFFKICLLIAAFRTIIYLFPMPCQFNLYQNSEYQDSEESPNSFAKVLLSTLLSAGAPLLVQLITDYDRAKIVALSRIIVNFLLGCFICCGLLVYFNKETCSLVSPIYIIVAVFIIFLIVLVFAAAVSEMYPDRDEVIKDFYLNRDKYMKITEDENFKDYCSRRAKSAIMEAFPHSFIGGLAIGSQFSDSNAYGVLACLCVVFHNVYNYHFELSSFSLSGYTRTAV